MTIHQLQRVQFLYHKLMEGKSLLTMIPLTILRSLFNHGFVKDLMLIFEQIKETTYKWSSLVRPKTINIYNCPYYN
ncbi:hypothetical protein SRABI80_00823 [Peribacillus frigoritolerans]|nr:hypothetical protein SRABI80_00823 [Peribacillus frigoritolerans]